jgi:hypothetical protein
LLSATGIDREYDAGTANNNKINTIPYEPRRRDAEDSDSNSVTNAVKLRFGGKSLLDSS